MSSMKIGLVGVIAFAAPSLTAANVANATIYDLTFTGDTAGMGNTVAPGSFTDYFNFTPPKSGDAQSYAAILSIDSGAVAGGMLTLYKGSATSGTELVSSPLVFAGFATGTEISHSVTAGDSYFLELSGDNTTATPLFYSVAVTSVPEPATWAMFGLGFASLGVVGLRGRKATRYAL